MADDFNLYEGLDTTPDLNTLVAPPVSAVAPSSANAFVSPSLGSSSMPLASPPASILPGFFQISTASSMSYRSEAPPTSKAENALYLTDLDWWTTDRQVRELCAPFGRVCNISFVVEKNGKSKGIAVVVFEDDSGAKNAVNDWRNPDRTPFFSGRPVGASVEMQNALPQPKRDSNSDNNGGMSGNRQNPRQMGGGGGRGGGLGNRNSNRPNNSSRGGYSRGDDDRRHDRDGHDGGNRYDREGDSGNVSHQRDHADSGADAGDARPHSDSKHGAEGDDSKYRDEGRSGGYQKDDRRDDRGDRRYDDRDSRRTQDGDRRDDRGSGGARRYDGGRNDDNNRDYRSGGNGGRSDDRNRYDSGNRGSYDNRRGDDRRGGAGGGGRDDRQGSSYRQDNRSHQQDGGNRTNYKKREREYDNEDDRDMRAGSPHRASSD